MNKACHFESMSNFLIFVRKKKRSLKKMVFTLNLSLISLITDLQGAGHNAPPKCAIVPSLITQYLKTHFALEEAKIFLKLVCSSVLALKHHIYKMKNIFLAKLYTCFDNINIILFQD